MVEVGSASGWEGVDVGVGDGAREGKIVCAGTGDACTGVSAGTGVTGQADGFSVSGTAAPHPLAWVLSCEERGAAFTAAAIPTRSTALKRISTQREEGILRRTFRCLFFLAMNASFA